MSIVCIPPPCYALLVVIDLTCIYRETPADKHMQPGKHPTTHSLFAETETAVYGYEGGLLNVCPSCEEGCL